MNIYILESRDHKGYYSNIIDYFSSEKKLIERVNFNMSCNDGSQLSKYNLDASWRDENTYIEYIAKDLQGKPYDVFLRYRKIKVN